MSNANIKLEEYVMKFGKYINMRAVDVSKLYVVDKNGIDQPIGLKYLKWLCDQDWFKHKDTISAIIKKAESCISEKEESEVVPKKKSQKKETIFTPKTVRKNKFVLESSSESDD